MASSWPIAFWDEAFWFPANRSWGWKDLVNKPGANIYLPDLKDIHWALLLGVVLIGVRYLVETIFVVPVAIWLGVPNRKKPHVTPNKDLETAYKSKKYSKNEIKILSKQIDMSEKQVEVWFRRRRKVDAPTPIQKFRECSWHLLFYTAFFFYGMTYLWQKEYFWSTIECWRNWPIQHVSNDMYWHYMIELAFYWSLVFTLFSDHKRKDFKEMIIHHFATIVLMYFSWVLNFVRVGTLVLVVHDAADTWLALAKMSIYAKNKAATDIFFGIFLLVWVLSRLIIYPFFVLYCTLVEPFTIKLIDSTFGAHQFFNFFLCVLLVLHFIWTYLIFRIVYRKMVKGNVEDVRSDSEDSGEESDTEDIEDEKEWNGNDNIKVNGKIINGNAAKALNCQNGRRVKNGK
ncbi:ceramide synthase 2-like isoform X2 [Ruditapes philippinarum]|nr:ceramide synthase 2-like isoform X2 [Ruditapes philippinarum]XP_060598841.1 ceramide synthase 2-like isoform X2 [Ruditapes philippinarum]XP_060598842.1 ceramide synthase 2-like isoform X2 [Ruditapes philippinarum]XP_060598843.1 ceramide synthase 2-like isoform X2 [Ruditapes philippinarum]XP_060598844.1 ceramide synthase 2-like isoform X2 [Ruditapes philippinarum]XP_060598845.1 ceramide synthase 2-like isoform X2 [Ruditapes philippinarum]